MIVEAAVGPHGERSGGSGVAHSAHRLPQEMSGAPRRVGTALAQPGHQHVAGSSSDGEQRVIAPLARHSCGAARPPWQVRRSRRRWSPGRWSTGSSPGPAPAAQARASTSRLTRSNCRTWPHRKLLRNVPSVDGALTTQPSTLSVLPARSASASSMQSPPANADATRVSSLSPALGRPGASPRST